MQSFGVKISRDLFSSGRGNSGLVDLEAGHKRRQWLRFRNAGGIGPVIVASASEMSSSSGGESRSPSSIPSSSPSSFITRSQTYAMLKKQMEVAAKSEDYKEAARIRDSLKLFENEEPVLRLRRLMKEAIASERYEDAAKYRNELKEIAPHSLLKCSSDATTLGIRVEVRSVYIETRSQPLKGQYFFAYRIRITNNSDRPVQLIRRHWIVTDANGKTENVWGLGVVGEHPVILPKTSFEYSSACPLTTASGRMEGDFEMKHIDRVGSPTFNVAIAPFALSTLGDDSESEPI